MTADVHPIKREYRFKLVPFDKIRLATSRPYLVKGLLPREGLVVVWGPPKCGKSFSMFDMSMHVALGWPYRGRRVTHGTVVYVACEGERGLGARVEAFRRARLAEDHASVSFHLLSTRLDLAGQFGELLDDIKAQLGRERPVAIVIDTLNRSLRGSESSDEDMGAYIKATDAIREAFGCAVVLIHHCGIDDKRPRGHTSLTGAADAQLAVRRDESGLITTTVEWLKDGLEGETTTGRLEVVEVGADEDGEPITSCVIMPTDEDERAAKRPVATGQARIALDLLRKAIEEAGELAPSGRRFPTGQNRVVRLDLWESYFRQGLVVESDKPDSMRKAFKRAAEKLQAAGRIGIWANWAWIVDKSDKAGQ
jgi:hypothetical protein